MGNTSSKPKGLGRNYSIGPVCEYIGNESSCSRNCSECPVDIKTQADNSLCMGEYDTAVRLYTQAVTMDETFAEAWNNLGTAFGLMSDYQRALTAYNHAIELDPTYGRALYGKAITLKNMDRKSEALLVLNTILEMYDDDGTKKLRDKLEGEKETAVQEDFFAGVNNLLAEMKKCGLVPTFEFTNFVPELLGYSPVVCKAYVPLIHKLAVAEGWEPIREIQVLGRMIFFAGMGAAYWWNKDWPTLKKKGILDVLGERGLENMDEYVTDIVGIGWNTPMSKQLNNDLFSLALTGFYYYIIYKHLTLDMLQTIRDRMCNDMYLAGISFQMHRMGMH